MNQPDTTPDATPSAASPKGAMSRLKLDRSTTGLLILVGLASAGLFYMQVRTAPLLALGAEQTASEAAIQTFLAAGESNIAKLQQSMKATRATVDQFTATPATLAAAKVERDPYAEPAVPRTAPKIEPAINRDADRNTLLAAAKQINVQSVIIGNGRRACLLNNKLYFEGQSVTDFKIELITQSAVTVSRDGLRFELRLNKK